jgi:hypothetical protein
MVYLTVSGQVDDSEKEYLEKGLAARKFLNNLLCTIKQLLMMLKWKMVY